jgi:hypothetical protein
MPRYDFMCGQCNRLVKDVFLPITHAETDRPVCCDATMGQHFTVPPMVAWIDPVIEPFRNPAAPRDSKDAVITSKKQRREFMAKNNLVDGNDFKPPSHQEQKEAVAEMEKSVKAITPTKEMAKAIPDIV